MSVTKKISFLFFCCLVLPGCPYEDSPHFCDKVMQCQEETEMVCDKNENGCGEDCHYYVVEHCWEECER